jgi:type IV secretory pathway TraG/TraD family ATPase VirD4
MQLGLVRRFDAKANEFIDIPVENDRRFSHTWVIGKTGVGKSTALIRWAVDDILAGDGVAFFDPHGDAAEEIMRHVPRNRRDDVVYFNPYELSIGFNPLDTVPEERKAFVASAIVDTFKSVWGYADIATPTLDQFLHNGARALMDMPDGTLFGLKFLLTSPTYRKRVISHIKDPTIADFWRTDFEEHMPEREQRERTLSTLNKIGALIADPAIRASIAQPRSRLDLKDIIETGKVLIVSLPQGQLGIEKSALIGSLILSQLHLAALTSTRSVNRPPFHIYVDECHHFGASTLPEMLSGIRKFGVSLVLAHQYLDQLPAKLKAALLGTVGTIVAFRIGAKDVDYIEPEFRLTNDDYSLCELSPFEAYARTGFTTHRLAMPEVAYQDYPGAPRRIRNLSRSQYAADREVVEAKIARFIAGT